MGSSPWESCFLSLGLSHPSPTGWIGWFLSLFHLYQFVAQEEATHVGNEHLLCLNHQLWTHSREWQLRESAHPSLAGFHDGLLIRQTRTYTVRGGLASQGSPVRPHIYANGAAGPTGSAGHSGSEAFWAGLGGPGGPRASLQVPTPLAQIRFRSPPGLLPSHDVAPKTHWFPEELSPPKDRHALPMRTHSVCHRL